MLIVRKAGHRELERFYGLFEMDFDRRELLPRLAIHRGMTRGDMELLIVTEEESRIDVAYALTFCRGLYGHVLLKYFAVLPWYRERGLGVQAMRLIHKYYADRQGILAELTVFDAEDGGAYLRKLRKFFARFGYVDVDCDYELGGAKAELLVKPMKSAADLSPVAHRVIRDFYSRVLSPAAEQAMIRIRPLERG